MISSLSKYVKRLKRRYRTQPELDERFKVDWVNFQKVAPPVRFWERVRGRILFGINFTSFVMLVTGLTYLLIISAEQGANKQYCHLLQKGSIQVIEAWHPECE